MTQKGDIRMSLLWLDYEKVLDIIYRKTQKTGSHDLKRRLTSSWKAFFQKMEEV